MQNVSSEVSQLIQLATGAPATNAQINAWTTAVNGGTSLLDLAKAFVDSDAFAANYHVNNAPLEPTNPLAQLAANVPNSNPLSGLLKAAFGVPTPFADTTPSVTLAQEIIDHALGQHTDAQVAAWANSGQSVAQVFLAFAQNDVWASTGILTNAPNFDGVLPDGEYFIEGGTEGGLIVTGGMQTPITIVGSVGSSGLGDVDFHNSISS